jgi:hypothetical protein
MSKTLRTRSCIVSAFTNHCSKKWKRHPKHPVSPRTTLTGGRRRIHGRQTPRLIVLDDVMHRVVQNVDMELLFTQGCHHRRLSVVFIRQNIFPRGTKSRTITLNTTYLVMMKNVRDVSQVATLERNSFTDVPRY